MERLFHGEAFFTGILGSWRRLSYWRDHEGIRLVMTNKRNSITFRYYTELDPSVKEIQISEDDTPKMILTNFRG
jgi:hypothetical protein